MASNTTLTDLTRTRRSTSPPRLQRSPSLPNLRRSTELQATQKQLCHAPAQPRVRHLSIRDVPATPSTQHPSLVSVAPSLPLSFRLRIEQEKLQAAERRQRDRPFDPAAGFRQVPRTKKPSLLTPPMTPSSSIGNRTTSLDTTASSRRTLDSMDLTTDGSSLPDEDDGVTSDSDSHVANGSAVSGSWAGDVDLRFEDEPPVPSRFIWVHNVPRTATNDTLRVVFFNIFQSFVPVSEEANGCGEVLKGIYVRHLQIHGVVLLAFWDIRQAETALAVIHDRKGALAFPMPNADGASCEWEITQIQAEFVAKDMLPFEISEAPFVKSTDAKFFLSANFLDAHGAIDPTRLIVPSRLLSSLEAFGPTSSFAEVTNEHDCGEHQQIFHVEFYDERHAVRAYQVLRLTAMGDLNLRVYGMEHEDKPMMVPSFHPMQINSVPFPSCPDGSANVAPRKLSVTATPESFTPNVVPPPGVLPPDHFRENRRVSFDIGRDQAPPGHRGHLAIDTDVKLSQGGTDYRFPFQPQDAYLQEAQILYESGPLVFPQQLEPPSPCFPPSPHHMNHSPSPLLSPEHEYRRQVANSHGFPSPPAHHEFHMPPHTPDSPFFSQYQSQQFGPMPPGKGPDVDRYFSNEHACQRGPVYDDQGVLEILPEATFAPQPQTPSVLGDCNGGFMPQSHLPSPCPSPPRPLHSTSRSNDASIHDRNQLDLQRIEAGQDTRTTVMLKNIPNKMTAEDLIAFIGAIVPRKIDFCYLRIDFQNECNVGYAFINFIEVEDLLKFAKAKLGVKWNLFSSEKVLQMSYATYQGKEALVEKFRNSCIMDERAEWRPRIFASAPGNGQGLPEAFPDPTHLRRKERGFANRGALFIPSGNSSASSGMQHFPRLPTFTPVVQTPPHVKSTKPRSSVAAK